LKYLFNLGRTRTDLAAVASDTPQPGSFVPASSLMSTNTDPSEARSRFETD
uniref:Transposase n=1 Tax=Gongylonema pulchrum TaxID=637853 RepID=A0A183D4M7_9BILA